MCHGIVNDPGNLPTISSGNRPFQQLHVAWVMHDIQSDSVPDQSKRRMREEFDLFPPSAAEAKDFLDDLPRHVSRYR
jgi:hypothetical protein